MFDKPAVTETHPRTLIKAAIYRIFSIVSTIGLTLILGGNWLQAINMGIMVLVVGTAHYYLYDRLWLWIPWQRTSTGIDSHWRSIVKAIIYRLTALLSFMILARAVFADTTLIAFLLASGKFVINATTYYILERVFNTVSWGKYKNLSKL